MQAFGAEVYIAEPGKDFPECDGLVLTGGVDVHPKYYGEEINGTDKIDDLRDSFEMSLCEKYEKAGKPILGICRGIQLINIYFGGTLHQDLGFIGNCHRNDKPDGVVHNVRAAKCSLVEKLYGDEFPVNSFHHQAVKNVAPGFAATALSTEHGIIEAIEHKTRPIFGVQWHPERMCLSHRRCDTVDGKYIFAHFVNLCKEYISTLPAEEKL